MRTWSKRGQVAIFVIVALVIVVGVVIYFAVKNNVDPSSQNPEFESVFTYYSSCIQEKAEQALDLSGSQGGRIDPGIYIPGSEYAPFSSQLNFLGFPVPYWFYLSGNGVAREKVPTKQEIEKEVSDYIINNMQECDYESFYS